MYSSTTWRSKIARSQHLAGKETRLAQYPRSALEGLFQASEAFYKDFHRSAANALSVAEPDFHPELSTTRTTSSGPLGNVGGG